MLTPEVLAYIREKRLWDPVRYAERLTERIGEEPCNAALLVDLLKRGGVEVEERPNMTNMVFFPLKEGQVGDAEFEAGCLEKGLLAHMISPRRARFVTHLDVDREDVERAAAIILEVLSA